MAIGPMQLNGILTRTQDFTAIKQNEDMRPVTEQTVYQKMMDKTIEKQMSRVKETEETDTYQRRQDAKEKGKNEYQGDGGRNRRQTQQESVPDGRVVVKNTNRFDCSV